MRIEIHPQPFSPWRELERHQNELPRGKFGACAVFVGTMRDFNLGDEVTGMTLEHYAGMTEHQLTALAEHAVKSHDLLDVLLLHRVGDIEPNDAIVLVAAWSAHRAGAFTACREMMEALKTRATFWKKEKLRDGERWVAGN